MKVAISEHVHCEPVDEEAVLLDLASGTYFGLDPVGAELWSLLVKTGATEGAVAAALDAFDVDPAELERDVSEFVRVLAENGLVSVE